MSDLEKRFHKAMIGIYEEAKKNGYTPVEALIQKPDWWPLFTKSEREKAKKRLVENGCPAGD
jgi:hypothetical protein